MSVPGLSPGYKLYDAVLQPSFSEQKLWATVSAQKTERHRVDSASGRYTPSAQTEKWLCVRTVPAHKLSL